jgi:hypothetical protein
VVAVYGCGDGGGVHACGHELEQGHLEIASEVRAGGICDRSYLGRGILAGYSL